jgi:hypothetical protein
VRLAGLAAVAAVVGMIAAAPAAEARGASVVVLDDGEHVMRDRARPLAASPWRGDAVSLFAMRGETVAFQIVLEAGADPIDGAHATIGALYTKGGDRLDAAIDPFVERFVEIRRPSGNDREPGSLAFTAAAAPPADRFTGFIADALVPLVHAGDVRVEPEQRGAIWIDLTVPPDARPGDYEAAILVRAGSRELAARPLHVRVIDRALPYAAAKTMVYYDTANLAGRMGDARAERELRALLHAHHLSAVREITTPEAATMELEALRGEAFTPSRGYRGPGEGIGEGVLAIGAYGALGEPSEKGAATVAAIADVLRAGGVFASTQTFVYAIDEDCASPWGARWRALLARDERTRGVRAGVTCGVDPASQPADLVMMTASDLWPSRARVAEAAPLAKWGWAYNGRRPYAGPLMIDVPATDLRANAWIAARYGIERWFYWESTFWMDGNRGGQGGGVGFDPFAVAETFHNADGDHCNGDGSLVYPGMQRTPGSVDYRVGTVFPSVRLKNLRRGIEDAGYIAIARTVDRARADAVVRRVIPRALAAAGERPSWPERGSEWIDARRDLAAIAIAETTAARVDDGAEAPRMSHGWSDARANSAGVAAVIALLLIIVASAVHRRNRRIRPDRGGE